MLSEDFRMSKPENYFSELVKEYHERTMTRKEFCKRKGISYTALHYAIVKVRKREEKEEPASFVQLSTTKDKVTFQFGKNHLDVTIEISSLIEILEKIL